MTDLSHRAICDVAVKWLKRPHSQKGHGCQFAAAEPQTGLSGEIPDAFGFRCSEYWGGSVVVEVKVSRSDFLADKGKPHRNTGGMGDWRYYMAPEGLIAPSDLPDGWGLVIVNPRGHLKVLAGAAMGLSGRYDSMQDELARWRQPANHDKERALLGKMLSRVSDPEQVNRWLRESASERARLGKEVERLREELRSSRLRALTDNSDRAKPRVVSHG
jgi:hypothetical protein